MVKHFFSIFTIGLLVSVEMLPLPAATNATPTVTPTQDNVRYVGAVTCQSSMCHGGASPSRDQFSIWSERDFHSRAYATLVTARSVQIAQGLGIDNASTSTRCTVCHAPLADTDKIPAAHLTGTVDTTDGVSCEACHGGASGWLRSHTRPDLSYADRVHSGMRDLRSAFVRANTCVACHQVIDPALLKAGHPELTFELDGQAASEPRHWREKGDWFGPKAWVVGQAVALREISRQAAALGGNDADLTAQQNALAWLLQQVPVVGLGPALGKPMDAAAWSNQLAESISASDWKATTTNDTIVALARTSSSFTDANVPLPERELRAERLVLGLDRLFKALHGETAAPGQAELAALFDAVQDRNRFDAAAFAQKLQQFADAIAVKK